jgi:hypothetical protein
VKPRIRAIPERAGGQVSAGAIPAEGHPLNRMVRREGLSPHLGSASEPAGAE